MSDTQFLPTFVKVEEGKDEVSEGSSMICRNAKSKEETFLPIVL